nr:unnamed protein product [Haemonchus contortus]
MSIIVTDIFELTGMAEPPYAEFDKMVNITVPSDKIDQWAEKMASQLLRTARQEKEEEEGPQFPLTEAPKCLPLKAKLALMKYVKSKN